MNGINGLIFGNLEGLRMKQGEKIDWYLMSLGTEVDMHNVHFHGQTVVAVSAFTLSLWLFIYLCVKGYVLIDCWLHICNRCQVSH